jgi:hypothetical protein
MIKDNTEGKWAVMVCIDVEEDDWIFVTENTGKCDMFDLRPVLFDDINEAMAFAGTFALPGKEENVIVVDYVEQV